MDHHTVAAISITGTCLDVVGSLYLAYDLLGGQHGPLRLLTRAVTYSIVFGVGYGIGLGLFFGLASGIATGITLSIEFNRAARGLDHYSLFWEGVFSAIRERTDVHLFQVGAQNKTAWRRLYLLAASQLNLREKLLGIQDRNILRRIHTVREYC